MSVTGTVIPVAHWDYDIRTRSSHQLEVKPIINHAFHVFLFFFIQ